MAATCNLVSMGVQPSEIGRVTWPFYLTLCLGRAEEYAAQNDVPEERDPAEQAMLAQDFMAILRGEATPEDPDK